MTANQRIILNTFATYLRSLYAMACALFTSRWILQILGQEDYGLLGVIAGLSSFITYINSILSISVGRFYAYAIGKLSAAEEKQLCLEEARSWFNTAVLLHSIVPMALIVILYPVGIWMVGNWLTIPADRIESCRWLFRCVCISCFVSMATVPYTAMYQAKQYIAELTIYTFVTATLNVVFLGCLIGRTGDWLVTIGFWNCILSVIPNLIISARALLLFPECRFETRYFFCLKRIKELGSFAGWYAFGMFGNLVRYQGLNVLVNKFFGPVQNAAMSIANNIAGQATNLSGALVGAFSPAITNACGAGDLKRMSRLVDSVNKYGALLLLIFLIPLSWEMREVLVLWLVNPPPESTVLAIVILVGLLIEKLTAGHWISISAMGKIALYQILIGIVFVLTLPIAWMMMFMGVNVFAAAYAFVGTLIMALLVRVILAWRIVGINPRYWLCRILLPVVALIVLTAPIAYVIQCIMHPSLLRVIVTTAVCESIIIPASWFLVLDDEERVLVADRIKKKIMKE